MSPDTVNQIKRLDDALDTIHEPYSHGLIALAVHELKLYHKQLKMYQDAFEDEVRDDDQGYFADARYLIEKNGG